MRNRLRIAVVVAAAAAVTGVGTAWATRPTGNAAAIAYARSVAAAYSRVAAVEYLQTGYVAMHSQLGRGSGFAWSWGTGVVPAGWDRVAESAVVALNAGRVAWFTDVLIPQGCNGTFCSEPPVKIVVTARGGYWRFDMPTAKACYRRLLGARPLTIGQRFVSVGGHYGPLVRHGNSVVTDYTYAWDADQTATETDVISARTRHVLATRVAVAKGSRPHQPRFTFQAAYKTLKSARPPRVKGC